MGVLEEKPPRDMLAKIVDAGWSHGSADRALLVAVQAGAVAGVIMNRWMGKNAVVASYEKCV